MTPPLPPFVAIGDGWVRVDQIAAVTRWEVILIGQGQPIALGDDVEPIDVLAAIDATTTGQALR